ncbi:Methyltransferase type 12 [Labilithrix luteola]|uniref:Methyltransferase type 12 n=2 Tax=Labilithrix luteola TaxID=1391654 RepID=A0A0K1Q7H2_9BACT|nr:Methyltransferase type 12 [Labilithrix luteola]
MRAMAERTGRGNRGNPGKRVEGKSETFDEAYYGRYYGEKRTRVHGPEEVARLCSAVTSFLDWWQFPIDTALDVGAGVGLWRDWFKKHRPKTKYRSVEVSKYACEQYGHELRDITKWHDKESYDLVVCQGVLPYLDDEQCAKAIENLAAMSGGFLYLEAITKSDIEEVCDDAKTDIKVHGRTGAWYRKRLERHFTPVGCGLWAKHDAPVLFYELERA